MAVFVGFPARPWRSCGMPRRPPSPGSRGRADRPARQPKGAGMRQFEQDWLELASRVARSLHYPAPPEPPTHPGSPARADRPAHRSGGRTMTEPSVSFAGTLTDDPELRHTEGGIARAMFRVAISGRREQEASFFTVIVWRAQAEHAAQSLAKGSRVVVVGRLQQRSWTAEDGSARSTVEVVAEELGPSLRWATTTTTRVPRS